MPFSQVQSSIHLRSEIGTSSSAVRSASASAGGAIATMPPSASRVDSRANAALMDLEPAWVSHPPLRLTSLSSPAENASGTSVQLPKRSCSPLNAMAWVPAQAARQMGAAAAAAASPEDDIHRWREGGNLNYFERQQVWTRFLLFATPSSPPFSFHSPPSLSSRPSPLFFSIPFSTGDLVRLPI